MTLIWLSAAETIVGAGGVAWGDGDAWVANTDAPQLAASNKQDSFIVFMLVISFKVLP